MRLQEGSVLGWVSMKRLFLRNVVIVDVVNIRVLGETKLGRKEIDDFLSAVLGSSFVRTQDWYRLLHTVFQNKHSNNDNNGPSYWINNT